MPVTRNMILRMALCITLHMTLRMARRMALRMALRSVDAIFFRQHLWPRRYLLQTQSIQSRGYTIPITDMKRLNFPPSDLLIPLSGIEF